MKKPTRIERHNHYINCLNSLHEEEFMCNNLSRLIGVEPVEVVNVMPEFALFKPNHLECPFGEGNAIWFDAEIFRENEKQPMRVTILLFCAEMCKP